MQLTLSMQMFNEKVRQMNQTNAKQLVLSAQEARNLHTDLYSLLTELSALALDQKTFTGVVGVMDGGGF